MSAEEVLVEHDAVEKEFVVTLSGGSDKAVLQYEIVDCQSVPSRSVLDLQHTYVPQSLRGRGIAQHLCIAGFEYAKQQGYLVKPTCSYVSDTFLNRNPEFYGACEGASSRYSSLSTNCGYRELSESKQISAANESNGTTCEESSSEEEDDEILEQRQQDHMFKMADQQYKSSLADGDETVRAKYVNLLLSRASELVQRGGSEDDILELQRRAYSLETQT